MRVINMPYLKFLTCGYEDCKNGHSWGPAIQYHHVIQYVVCGKGYYVVKGKRYSLSKGQCFYIIPGEITHYYPDMSDPWIYRWISFGGADADEVVARTSLTVTPVTPSLDLGEIFEGVTNDVISPAVRLKNEAYLHGMLAFFTEHFPSADLNQTVDYLHVAKRYITNNLNRSDLSVEGIADAIGIERSYLFRLFKEKLSMSVKDYIIKERLEKAEEMFKSGITQVGIVAYSCGYSDPLYFSNAFKKKYRRSPREYIKRLGG